MRGQGVVKVLPFVFLVEFPGLLFRHCQFFLVRYVKTSLFDLLEYGICKKEVWGVRSEDWHTPTDSVELAFVLCQGFGAD